MFFGVTCFGVGMRLPLAFQPRIFALQIGLAVIHHLLQAICVSTH